MLVVMNVLLLQDSAAIIARIWEYLTKPFTFGRITVSVSTFITGVAVILVTIFVARWTSALLERRIANRRHIDPGLRYTICRLGRYIVITIGALIALTGVWTI